MGHSQQDMILLHQEGKPEKAVLQLLGKNCNLDVVTAAKHGRQDGAQIKFPLSKLSTVRAYDSDSSFWQPSHVVDFSIVLMI